MRIAIAEDYLLLRDLLRTICVKEFGYTVVAEANSGPQAVEEIFRTKPDILLLDLHLPGFDGFTVIDRIRGMNQAPRTLILSSYCDDYTVARVEQAAVHGFVDKVTSTMAVLREAIGAVADNRNYFSESYCQARDERRADANAFDARLSARERSLLVLFGQFLTDDEIARQLKISCQTVEKHRFNIHRKLGLKSRAELMRYVRDHGFLAASK